MTDTVQHRDTSVREVSRGRDVAHARPRRHPVRWTLNVVGLVVLAQIAVFVATNERFEWDVVAEYMTAPTVLEGLGMTVFLTVVGMTLGSLLGIALGLARTSQVKVLAWSAWAYTRFFFGVPMLVQLIFWFNLGYLLPEISIGIPFGGPTLASWETNDLISPLVAAILALTLHEAAYMAEIVRAGLMSVGRGQTEASAALGLDGWKTFRLVVLPQAMRFIIPPTGNQVIGMLKGTSLVSVVAVGDLLRAVSDIYDRTFQVVPLLIVACLWYFVVISVLDVFQRRIERHFGRGLASPVLRTRRQWLARRMSSTSSVGGAP